MPAAELHVLTHDIMKASPCDTSTMYFAVKRVYCFRFYRLSFRQKVASLIKVRNVFQADGKKIRTSETDVYVITAQKGLVEERMKLCRILWDHDIKVCAFSIDLQTKHSSIFAVVSWTTDYFSSVVRSKNSFVKPIHSTVSGRALV